MKLETENRKRPKETKASSSWERTGPRWPCTRKAGRRAPRSRGRVAAPCAARVPTFPPPPAPSRPCPGQLSLLLRRESSCSVLQPRDAATPSAAGRPSWALAACLTGPFPGRQTRRGVAEAALGPWGHRRACTPARKWAREGAEQTQHGGGPCRSLAPSARQPHARDSDRGSGRESRLCAGHPVRRPGYSLMGSNPLILAITFKLLR